MIFFFVHILAFFKAWHMCSVSTKVNTIYAGIHCCGYRFPHSSCTLVCFPVCLIKGGTQPHRCFHLLLIRPPFRLTVGRAGMGTIKGICNNVAFSVCFRLVHTHTHTHQQAFWKTPSRGKISRNWRLDTENKVCAVISSVNVRWFCVMADVTRVELVLTLLTGDFTCYVRVSLPLYWATEVSEWLTKVTAI